MTKSETMKVARTKRDNERETLKHRNISHNEYIEERKRINNEYIAVKEANKPTHQRLAAWQKADNAAFERWNARQSPTGLVNT